MVAWLIAASTHFLGISAYAVRLPALLCGGLYLIWIYYLGERLFDRQVGLWGMLAAAATPILAVYSFVMTIDPPSPGLLGSSPLERMVRRRTKDPGALLRVRCIYGLRTP